MNKAGFTRSETGFLMTHAMRLFLGTISWDCSCVRF